MADQQIPREIEFVKELLLRDDEVGAAARKMAREKYPDANIPEPNPNKAVEREIAPVKAELDGVKTQLKEALDRLAAKEKADNDLRAENEMGIKLADARKRFGLTDAGYEKMVKRMQETGNVTDADAAAAWVVSQTPKPEPTTTPTWLPESSNLFGTQKRDEQWTALHQDPRRYLDDQLREFVSDPEKYTNETFGNA